VTGDYLPAIADHLPGPRIFCLPHAGGTASLFSGWRPLLAPVAQVVPVQLPGRENRSDEPLPEDLDSLVDALTLALGERLDHPYLFYGHGMGGLIAHRTTLRLAEAGLRMPCALIIGACGAPHAQNALVDAHHQDGDVLPAPLAALDGISPLFRGYPDWLVASVQRTRRDLRLCATGRPRLDPPLPCPIRAFHGTFDAHLTAEEMTQWAAYTTDRFTLTTVLGGHFFHRDSAHQFLPLLRQSVLELTNSLLQPHRS
jgi:surfactin synthase thioesterase subunit